MFGLKEGAVWRLEFIITSRNIIASAMKITDDFREMNTNSS